MLEPKITPKKAGFWGFLSVFAADLVFSRSSSATDVVSLPSRSPKKSALFKLKFTPSALSDPTHGRSSRL
jgi:hypothetical protein